MNLSIMSLISLSIGFCCLLMSFFNSQGPKGGLSLSSTSLFPLVELALIVFIFMFVLLSLLNLISLSVFSYPVTTTLAFNLSAALIMWLFTILFLTFKKNWMASFLPTNSPWYLVPFLSLVEMVSIFVRPITLCFRLLANMSAGHILLSLICKLPFYSWLTGAIFGVLELMVAVVQSFVFLMLVSVYLEEGLSH